MSGTDGVALDTDYIIPFHKFQSVTKRAMLLNTDCFIPIETSVSDTDNDSFLSKRLTRCIHISPIYIHLIKTLSSSKLSYVCVILYVPSPHHNQTEQRDDPSLRSHQARSDRLTPSSKHPPLALQP